MTQKFKCPQKTHKFLRIERNRIENTEISIFYILYSILTSFYIRHQHSCFTWAVRAPLTRLY